MDQQKSYTFSTDPGSRKCRPYCLSIVYSSQKVSVAALTPFSPAYDLTRPNIAAISSNLGTDVAFVGVTFAFTAIIAQSLFHLHIYAARNLQLHRLTAMHPP